MFPIIYCPFLFGCRRSWLRWDLVFIFLWLMKSILWSLHFISKQSLTPLAFLENLSPWEKKHGKKGWQNIQFVFKGTQTFLKRMQFTFILKKYTIWNSLENYMSCIRCCKCNICNKTTTFIIKTVGDINMGFNALICF